MDLFRLYLSDLKKKNRFMSFLLLQKERKASLGKKFSSETNTRLNSARERARNNIENDDDDEKHVTSQSTCPLRSFLRSLVVWKFRALRVFER